MKEHHTKTKADFAVAATIFDLSQKGFAVFTSFSEHLPFDLIAYKDNKCYRIQVKYRSNGVVPKHTVWNDKHGAHKKYYDKNDFDYYAIYLPNVNKIVYPNIKFAGCTIQSVVPNSATPFYWFEDFFLLTDLAEKKSMHDFGMTFTHKNKGRLSHMKGKSSYTTRKVIRPNADVLHKQLWEMPTTDIAKFYGVSDKAIEKWAKIYGIEKPPRGYWAKQRSKS